MLPPVTGWRGLVGSEKLNAVKDQHDLFKVLDRAEKEIPSPDSCPGRNCEDLLAEWIARLIKSGAITRDEYDLVRHKLGLKVLLPQVQIP